MLQKNDLNVARCLLCIPKGGFRRHTRGFGGYTSAVCAAFVLTFALCPPMLCGAAPSALKPGTLEAFRRYVQATDLRNNTELEQDRNFLWVDSLPEAARNRAYQSLAQGDVQIEPRNTLADGRAISCPGGMIHHWEGLVFIPGAHLADVLKILQDYDRHSTYYAPDVDRSRIESRNADHFRVFLRFRRKKIITVVLNTEHDVTYFRDAPDRAHSRSSAVRIAEVEDPGKSGEREKPPGDDNGFLWGMETWWRLLEKDGGVYVQSEVVSLTRDIPTGLGWMIGPFITSIPRDTLTFTLRATRKAVLAEARREQNDPANPAR